MKINSIFFFFSIVSKIENLCRRSRKLIKIHPEVRSLKSKFEFEFQGGGPEAETGNEPEPGIGIIGLGCFVGVPPNVIFFIFFIF